jgi:hypothetical protein
MNNAVKLSCKKTDKKSQYHNNQILHAIRVKDRWVGGYERKHESSVSKTIAFSVVNHCSSCCAVAAGIFSEYVRRG